MLCSVFMSSRVNEDRLAEDGPVLLRDIEDEFKRQCVENAVAQDARAWDPYRDVVQLSFLHQGHYAHFMLCEDNPETLTVVEATFTKLVQVYDNESDLIVGAFGFLNDVFGESGREGCTQFGKVLVGFRTASEIWPVLVNRAIRYGIPVYRDMLSNPDSRYSTVRNLADIASIYRQGAGPERKMPSLPNLLRFWGCDRDGRLLPQDIAAAVCGSPLETSRTVDLYLKDILDVASRYYMININQDPLAGVPVPGPGDTRCQ